MKHKIIISVLIFSLIPFWGVFSQEKAIEGEISLTGKYVGIEGQRGGKAKFTQYRDLQENGGVYGRVRLNLDTEKYFLNFKSGDFGYDTFYYQADGGLWGKVQFDLFYNEIPHHMTFDARTFYRGAGGDTLTGVPNPNVAAWNTFDYSSERRQLGGRLNLKLIKPFFFDASYQREERFGIKPTGAAGDPANNGDIALELPEPTHYLTNNLKLETGYAKNPLYLSFKYFYSDFNNSNTALNFFNSTLGVQDVHSLPPDNTYHKGSFKGAVKLPFNTKFSTNIGFSKGKSETSAFPTTLGPPADGRTDFKGKVNTLNYNAVLTSNPVRFFDAKVFYKLDKRDNKSDVLPGLVEGFLDYKINEIGGDAGFRLPAKFYLTGGYKYVHTRRNFYDDPNAVLPHNSDNIYSVGLKWSGLDFLDARVGYEKLKRDAKYQSPETSAQLDRKYAYAAQDRDTIKAAVDIFPIENLNFGLEYRHRKIDYNDTTVGLKKDKRDEIGFSVDYSIGKVAKLFGNTDFGWVKFSPDLQRLGLNWDAKQKEKTFGYGLGAEIYAIPSKLTFIFQHNYLKSNGNVDFTLDPGLFIAGNGLAGANNDTVDISKWDDYTLYNFKIKTIYQLTKRLSVSVGYGYERFNFKDAQLDGYQFAPNGVASNGAYLTGAYKDQSYRAHLVFGGMTYKF